MPLLPQPKGWVSLVTPGFTHGIYFVPDCWPFTRAYMHARESYETATNDAYQLACVDDSGYYFVQDYETGEIVYKSRPDD